jgi:hypothetical protein
MAYAGPDLVGSHESFFWVLGTDRLTLAFRLPETMTLLGRLLSVYVALPLLIQKKLMATMLDLLEGTLTDRSEVGDPSLTPDELEKVVFDTKIGI